MLAGKAIYRNQNNRLKSYWYGKFKTNNVIDFRIESLSLFTIDELIFYFNVARTVCKYIYSAIMFAIDKDEVIKYELEKKFPNKNIYAEKVLIRKAKNFWKVI